MAQQFTSEILSSGVHVQSVEGKSYDFLLKSDYGQWLKLTKSDINRLHGIAFPEVRRTGCCHNSASIEELSEMDIYSSQVEQYLKAEDNAILNGESSDKAAHETEDYFSDNI